MEQTVKTLALHSTVKSLLEDLKADLARFKERPQYYHSEIPEKEMRIAELRRLWRKFNNTPLTLEMTAIVDRLVEHYHADFFYHDLSNLEKYSGRFLWSVGNCGTHMLWLDVDSEETLKNQQSWLEAYKKSYGHYTVYEGNNVDGTLKKSSYDNSEFRLVKSMLGDTRMYRVLIHVRNDHLGEKLDSFSVYSEGANKRDAMDNARLIAHKEKCQSYRMPVHFIAMSAKYDSKGYTAKNVIIGGKK